MNDLQRPPLSRGVSLSVTLAVALLLALGLALRVVGVGREGLWIDEIYSASFTNLSLFETLVACLRFDVHPPLHYLQLNLWSALGHGDTWLMLNPILWGMVTLVLVLVITARRFGTLAGVIALAFCAVMGSQVYFANELRSYTMLGACMLLSWPAADRLLRDYRLRAGLPLMALLILIGGLHSFGAIAICGVLLYVFPFGDTPGLRRGLPTWLSLAAIVGVGVAPWVANGVLRHVGHLEPTTVAGVVYTVSGWTLGYRAIDLPQWLQVTVTLLEAAVLVFAMMRIPRLRRVLTCYVIWPLGFTALVCVVWKPIWLFRPFSFCAPFLAVACGALLGQFIAGRQETPAPAGIRAVCAALAAAAVAAIGWLSYLQATTPWKTQYREAAAYLREHVQPTEIIYIPDHIVFWGVARYLVGPQWGSVLAVQDPVNQDRSAFWPGIYRRLGPKNTARRWIQGAAVHRLVTVAADATRWCGLGRRSCAESV
jgi:hypothetical protein